MAEVKPEKEVPSQKPADIVREEFAIFPCSCSGFAGRKPEEAHAART